MGYFLTLTGLIAIKLNFDDLYYYAGYVAGVAEVTRLKDNVSWCEESATVAQLVKVVSRYLTNTPEKLHLLANSLLVDALKSAFPCKK